MARILIVEDEVQMQQGLKDNLEFEGYDVDTADDGEQCLSMVEKNDYNLILLDIMLPKLSGFDVCKHLRGKGFDRPIIMLTAKGEEIDKVLTCRHRHCACCEPRSSGQQDCSWVGVSRRNAYYQR